jgi:hypothetical protein
MLKDLRWRHYSRLPEWALNGITCNIKMENEGDFIIEKKEQTM